MRRALAIAGLTALLAAGGAVAGLVQQFPTGFQSLTFKANSSKVVFKGTLGSPDEKCIKGRKAKLIRKHDGDKKTLASDESDSDGKFKLKVENPPLEGKFYGLIKQKKLNDGTACLEKQTASLTISTS
jgi:hypothetical protein